uniref:CSON006217 protein n=1 Tax=Culicoides sonorensis TaxID=179676 RepID=A0A336MST3_CULSO
MAYKYILTLSFTQVSCERSFSTLKFIKNKLRSTLSQENLEAFMLMNIEKDILVNLDTNKLINNLADTIPGNRYPILY